MKRFPDVLGTIPHAHEGSNVVIIGHAKTIRQRVSDLKKMGKLGDEVLKFCKDEAVRLKATMAQKSIHPVDEQNLRDLAFEAVAYLRESRERNMHDDTGFTMLFSTKSSYCENILFDICVGTFLEEAMVAEILADQQSVSNSYGQTGALKLAIQKYSAEFSDHISAILSQEKFQDLIKNSIGTADNGLFMDFALATIKKKTGKTNLTSVVQLMHAIFQGDKSHETYARTIDYVMEVFQKRLIPNGRNASGLHRFDTVSFLKTLLNGAIDTDQFQAVLAFVKANRPDILSQAGENFLFIPILSAYKILKPNDFQLVLNSTLDDLDILEAANHPARYALLEMLIDKISNYGDRLTGSPICLWERINRLVPQETLFDFSGDNLTAGNRVRLIVSLLHYAKDTPRFEELIECSINAFNALDPDQLKLYGLEFSHALFNVCVGTDREDRGYDIYRTFFGDYNRHHPRRKPDLEEEITRLADMLRINPVSFTVRSGFENEPPVPAIVIFARKRLEEICRESINHNPHAGFEAAAFSVAASRLYQSSAETRQAVKSYKSALSALNTHIENIFGSFGANRFDPANQAGDYDIAKGYACALAFMASGHAKDKKFWLDTFVQEHDRLFNNEACAHPPSCIRERNSAYALLRLAAGVLPTETLQEVIKPLLEKHILASVQAGYPDTADDILSWGYDIFYPDKTVPWIVSTPDQKPDAYAYACGSFQSSSGLRPVVAIPPLDYANIYHHYLGKGSLRSVWSFLDQAGRTAKVPEHQAITQLAAQFVRAASRRPQSMAQWEREVKIASKAKSFDHD